MRAYAQREKRRLQERSTRLINLTLVYLCWESGWNIARRRSVAIYASRDFIASLHLYEMALAMREHIELNGDDPLDAMIAGIHYKAYLVDDLALNVGPQAAAIAQLQPLPLTLNAGVLKPVLQIGCPHPVGKIIVVGSLDDDIRDFGPRGALSPRHRYRCWLRRWRSAGCSWR